MPLTKCSRRGRVVVSLIYIYVILNNIAHISTMFTEVPEIRHASRLAVRELGLLQSKYRDTGCSHVHCHALLEIDQRGQSTVAELATVLQVDKSTASRTVSQLVRLGWVAVEKAPDDRRSKLLVLTPSGQHKAESINESANEQVQSALEQLSDEERGKVLQGMELYARALGRARRCGNFEIRPIERSDNTAVARLIRDVMAEFGAVGEGFSRSDPEVRAMYESYSGERAAYFVVVRKGTVVGGAGIGQLEKAGNQICQLRKMYVRPEARGAGVGQKLLRLCLDTAKKIGYTSCYLETLEQMAQARRLYEKAGFKPLSSPLGDTGHFSCNSWYQKDL